jgi:hypothetical protein
MLDYRENSKIWASFCKMEANLGDSHFRAIWLPHGTPFLPFSIYKTIFVLDFKRRRGLNVQGYCFYEVYFHWMLSSGGS